MSQKNLFSLWGGLYIVCAGLGFIPEPDGLLGAAMTVLSVIFFIPPAMLLRQATQDKDARCLMLVRNFAMISLGLTMALLVLSFLTALRSAWLGAVVHYVLIVVSSPMVCSGYWALSLFFWAATLIGSLSALKQIKL